MKIKNTPYIRSRRWKDNIADKIADFYEKMQKSEVFYLTNDKHYI